MRADPTCERQKAESGVGSKQRISYLFEGALSLSLAHSLLYRESLLGKHITAHNDKRPASRPELLNAEVRGGKADGQVGHHACARDSDPQEFYLGIENITMEIPNFSIVNISWGPATVFGGRNRGEGIVPTGEQSPGPCSAVRTPKYSQSAASLRMSTSTGITSR